VNNLPIQRLKSEIGSHFSFDIVPRGEATNKAGAVGEIGRADQQHGPCHDG